MLCYFASVLGITGLRDYGVDGQLGLEKTPEEYVQKLVEVFREVKRVLRDDGTLWLNLGDSYWGGKGQSAQAWSTEHTERDTLEKSQHQITGKGETRPQDGKHDVIKPKDLVGIPWRVAFALQADGWWLRSDIIWAKSNTMPESVTDRPTKAHEYIFLLTKSRRYYYDACAVAEPISESYASDKRPHGVLRQRLYEKSKYVTAGMIEAGVGDFPTGERVTTRNLRTVWEICTQPRKEAHFATFPDKIPEICIKAGTSQKGQCAKCGSPRKRVTEKERTATRPGATTSKFGD